MGMGMEIIMMIMVFVLSVMCSLSPASVVHIQLTVILIFESLRWVLNTKVNPNKVSGDEQ